MILQSRTKYLQVALNGSVSDAQRIVMALPRNDRILVEAGTPLIKQYGIAVVRQLKQWWGGYVVADLKTMDRGETEVRMAAGAGASGVVALGNASVETLNVFVETCLALGVDSMIDMMHVDQPIKVLRKLRKKPDVVILHRGVDEETFNSTIPIPYIQINKVRSLYGVMIAIAGGDDIREVQRAIFNDANIAVVWKPFYQASGETGTLVEEFLRVIK